jgi:N-hydroxyarylamine O-acetyltransferase
MPGLFDADAYLARIAFIGPVRPDLTTLFDLHRAHLESIPFENLDIQMGLPVRLDPASIRADLVDRRRGGYCFQQNGLFRLALTALGFTARRCEARVGAGTTPRPRTHMTLVVPLGGSDWLVDVGFGAEGIAEPLRIGGPPADQDGWTYRTAATPRGFVLQRAREDGWEDLYECFVDEVYDVDYEVGNWYTSTHPDSSFVRTLTAQRMLGPSRHIVRNLTYTVGRNGGWRTEMIERAALVPLLRGVFGLDVPAGAAFRALDSTG